MKNKALLLGVLIYAFLLQTLLGQVVSGPLVSTNRSIPFFNSTNGKLIGSSGAMVDVVGNIWFAGPGTIIANDMTTAQRNALSATNGMVIYNTSTGQLEAYEAGSWGALGGAAETGDSATAFFPTGRIDFPRLPTNGAAFGQVLKFDGTDFTPGADATGGAGTTYVNGGPISDANLVNSTSLNLSVTASTNVAFTPTNLLNSQISPTAAIDATKLANGTVTSAELQFLASVTSDVQAQLNAKGTGSVTSVGLSVPSQFSASGSPITGAGLIAVALTNSTGSGAVVLSSAPSITNASLVTPALTNPVVTGKFTHANLPTNSAAVGQVLKFDGLTYTNGADATGGGGAIYINGAPITDANLTNTSTLIAGVASGTNVSLFPTNLANAQIAAGASIDKSKIATAGVWPTAGLGSGTADDNALLRGDQTWVRSVTDGNVMRQSGGAADWGALNLASGNAVSGTLSDGNLSANVAQLNGTNTWTGTQNFTLPTILTNLGNTISGNGAGLTNLPAASINGTVSAATNASTVTVIDGTDTTSHPVIVDSATGNLVVKTDAGWSYNAGVGQLTAVSYLGSGAGLTVDASAFSGNLSTTDTNLQLVVNALDALALVSGPAGADTQVQYNNSGSMDGASGITVGAETNLIVTGTLSTGTSGTGQIDVGSTGVRLSEDGDGAITFLGLGNGTDEDFTLNLDDTADNVVASSSTGVTNVGFGSIGITALSFVGPLIGNASSATTLPTGTTLTNVTSSGVLKLANGSSSAPSLSFTADATLGLFYGGTTTLGLAGGGSNRFNFTSAAFYPASDGVMDLGNVGGSGRWRNAYFSGAFSIPGNITNGVLTASAAVVTDANKALASVAYTGSGNVMRTRVGVVRSMAIPMGAWFTNGMTGSLAALTNLTASGDTYGFDDAVTNTVRIRLPMPVTWDVGVVKFQFEMSSTGNNTSSTNVVYQLKAGTSLSNAGAEQTVTFGTAITFTNHVSATSNRMVICTTGPLTIGNTPAVNAPVIFELTRLTSDAVDVNTNRIHVLGSQIFYTETATEPSMPTTTQ